jgi:hypothetical protein
MFGQVLISINLLQLTDTICISLSAKSTISAEITAFNVSQIISRL